MYRHHQAVSGGEQQQQQFSTSSSAFNHSPLSGSMSNVGDSNIPQNAHHLSPPARPGPQQLPHSRQTSNEWQGLQRHTSHSISPRPKSVTPAHAPYVPADRSLPSRDVTTESITDAYVAFILYCNPSFALDVDTTTLKTNFQSVPKSDNKDFEIYRLFELIQKFHAKEIKTWGQLALDLGVESPDISKGQSVQKVQQYSVRLKRWMRAMHVDTFFEYLLGKEPAYARDIPPPNDPYPSDGRDGVVVDEDLAIRALDPSFRPKRGRRRNSETEQEEEAAVGTGQLSDDLPTSAIPGTMMPFSSNTSNMTEVWTASSAVTPHSFAPWSQKSDQPQSAITASTPSQLRWHSNGSSRIPGTSHPMSATPGPMAAHVDAAFDNEPKSAITPSSRKRRKHGPAVSSAWQSGSTPGSKPRGRPPASRNVQDGPFTTFPADPANERLNTPTVASSVAQADEPISNSGRTTASAPPVPIPKQNEGLPRPERLSLQVPPHTGAPVRLATPPRLMVTGEGSDIEQPRVDSRQYQTGQPQIQTITQSVEKEMPGLAFETLKRVIASDLLRAELVGRRQRLSGDEAKRLADAVLVRMEIPRADTASPNDETARLTAASWLGLGGQLNIPLGPANGQNKRITVTRLRIDAEGYEEIVPPDDETSRNVREIFDLSWTATLGGCTGSFGLKGLSLSDPLPAPQDVHDNTVDTWIDTARRVGIDEERIRRTNKKYQERFGAAAASGSRGDDGVDWKAKYQILEFGTRMAKGEFDRFRQLLIERVLDTII